MRHRFSSIPALVACILAAVSADARAYCSTCTVEQKVRLAALESEFRQARDTGKWDIADGLVPQILGIEAENGDAVDYLIYDRHRCGDALVALSRTRLNRDPGKRQSSNERLKVALVCEAARMDSSDPAKAKVLLGEAIDLELEAAYFTSSVDLYGKFASADHLDLAVLRFLKKYQLDADESGRAMGTQISKGNVANVRTLLDLGADPNERHGIQHAALYAAESSLRNQGEKALEITRLLLDYGADPTMMIDFSSLDKDRSGNPLPKSPLQPQLDAMLKDAAGRIKRANPIDADFYDYEWNGPPSNRPSYARFYVYNRTDKPVTLDMFRDDEGFDFAGGKTVIECQIPPSVVWRPCGNEEGLPTGSDWKRISLGGNQMTLLRVPISIHILLDGPPTLRLRMRIPSTDGIDYVSEPFSLHDSRYVRDYWPQKGRVEPVNHFPGAKLELGPGVKSIISDEFRNAPHDRVNEDLKTNGKAKTR